MIVDPESLKSVIKMTSGIVILFFTTPWCQPCKKIMPKIDEYKKISKVILIKINCDECYEITTFYKCTSVPTFIRFENGTEVDRYCGVELDAIRRLFPIEEYELFNKEQIHISDNLDNKLYKN